ncbi:MAG: hypothetical protein QXD62_01460 [Candidatus Woesearchaeota archaeon]
MTNLPILDSELKMIYDDFVDCLEKQKQNLFDLQFEELRYLFLKALLVKDNNIIYIQILRELVEKILEYRVRISKNILNFLEAESKTFILMVQRLKES